MNRYEFTQAERKIIYERDNYSCIMPGCNRTFGLGIAHIFFPRSKGGLGVRENGVLLCGLEHTILDSKTDSKRAIYIEDYCKNYLHEHHEFNEQDLKYNKFKNFKFK